MRAPEAKTFLVQQISQQAQLDGIELSDLEKRMLYFTEGSTAVEDPVALNEEFEAQYDTAKFEKKISRLMHSAYQRLKQEGPSGQHAWDDAIRRLKRGDHYILVMWDQRPGIHGAQFIGYAVGILLLATLIGVKSLAREVSPPNPRILQAAFLAVVAAIIFFPSSIGNALGWLADKTVMGWMGADKEDE